MKHPRPLFIAVFLWQDDDVCGDSKDVKTNLRLEPATTFGLRFALLQYARVGWGFEQTPRKHPIFPASRGTIKPPKTKIP